MGKSKDLGHLAHIVTYDSANHITVPAGITMHTNQLVASQAWVTTALGSYALSTSLGSYVPTSRTITINGTVYDLSENREWNITSMIYPAAGIPLSTGSAWGTSITNNSANWNTAFGWGNHATAGYLTAITSLLVTNALGFTPYNSTNPAGYITGITSLMVTTALGYTPYNSTNPSGYITSSSLTWTNISSRPTALSSFTNDVGFITGVTNISGNSATTSQRDFNYLRVNSNNHLYLDYNYGQTIIGVYSASRFQGVFSMGAAYVLPLDGTSPGNLYGMAWSHPNAGGQAGYLNTHGLLVMENGVTNAAIASNIWARGSITANTYVYGSANIRLGDMWGGAGLYRPSGNMVFGTEGADWVFSRSAQTQAYFAGGDGNLWLRWSGEFLSTTLARKHENGANPSYGAVYATNWFRAQGDCGLYQQDYGGHLRRNATSSHGTWEIFGYNKGGYTGLNINDPQGYWNNYMHESGSGGLYSQNYRGDWIWYHNAGQNCTSFNGSTTDGGVRFRVNGSMRVTQDFNPQGYTGFGGNVEWANGSTQYHGSNTAYNWRDWGGWGGYWWSRNGGDMIMNLYAVYAVTGSISDIRYKKDVDALPYGLNEIMQLNPIKYHYNLPKESMLSNDPDYFLGFSAQEVQALIREAVHEKVNEDVESLKGMLAITYDELIPVTVQAIKEQQVMIHNQNIRIQKLEALVTQLLNN